MNAVVSGQAGVALLLDGDTLSSVRAGHPGEVVRRSPGEVPLLFGDARDLQFLEGVELEEVTSRLERANEEVDALHLALILLDESLEPDTRRTAAEELEESLETAEIRRFVENILFAQPLPRGADLAGARAVCPGSANLTRYVLEWLGSLQGAITEVYFAWEQIPEELFEGKRDRAYAQLIAVREGFFRDLIVFHSAAASVDIFLARSLPNASFQRVHNYNDILWAWVSPLRLKQARVEVAPSAAARPRRNVAQLLSEPASRPFNRGSIGRSVFIKGDLSGEEDLIIEGRVDGNVDLKQNSVTVARHGRVHADIFGRVVAIEGEVDGNVFAREQVILRKSGAIRGNITAPRVVLEDGSRFKGSIDMNSPKWDEDRPVPVELMAEERKLDRPLAVTAAPGASLTSLDDGSERK